MKLKLSFLSPSGPADEAKLFLWWHKALQLIQVQVEQGDGCALDYLILTLQGFQARLALLGEERLNSGILGAIGLGRKSPLSSRYGEAMGRVLCEAHSTRGSAKGLHVAEKCILFG